MESKTFYSREHYNISYINISQMLDTTRFEKQEVGIGTISPKMIKLQLKGDTVVDINFKTLSETPNA